MSLILSREPRYINSSVGLLSHPAHAVWHPNCCKFFLGHSVNWNPRGSIDRDLRCCAVACLGSRPNGFGLRRSQRRCSFPSNSLCTFRVRMHICIVHVVKRGGHPIKRGWNDDFLKIIARIALPSLERCFEGSQGCSSLENLTFPR